MSFEPGWVECGCCAGVEWGGEYPRPCQRCGETGLQYRYTSGRLALYPGGPFCGSEHPDYKRPVIKAERQKWRSMTTDDVKLQSERQAYVTRALDAELKLHVIRLVLTSDEDGLERAREILNEHWTGGP